MNKVFSGVLPQLRGRRRKWTWLGVLVVAEEGQARQLRRPDWRPRFALVRLVTVSTTSRCATGAVLVASEWRRCRVPGVRRRKLFLLAGVSTDLCTRMEKGHAAGVSAVLTRATPDT